jgi:septal ring-binding cell division protein DamX
MTVRYTAVEGMEDPALRDVDRNAERWRDKIELRLDNRQVFFLFFGSAVVACMLFVLGVIVGKRIESRGRAEAMEVQDPLAALDRAHEPSKLVAGPAAPPTELAFPKALAPATGNAKGSRADRSAAIAALPKPIVPAAALPKPVAQAQAPALAPKPIVPAAALPKPVVAAPKPVVAAAPPKPVTPPVDAAKGKGKFTLQLSAFPTREEAEAFAKKYDGTFIIPTEIPGKGTWFRVRAGNYASFNEAAAAKTAFEKQNKIIALVSAR